MQPFWIIRSSAKLGEDAAQGGDRETALTYARRALAVSSPTGPLGKAHAEVQEFYTARGLGAMAVVYPALAHSSASGPEQVREDRRQAELWGRTEPGGLASGPIRSSIFRSGAKGYGRGRGSGGASARAVICR